MNLRNFYTNSCFSRSGNPLRIFQQSYHVCVNLENLGKLPVQDVLRRYWWMCFIDFWNFLTIHVFGVKESIADISTELPCLGDLENPGWPSGPTRTWRYWWLCLVDFLKFLHHLCFWGQQIIWWHSYWATMFGRPQKFRSPSGSRSFLGYPNIRSLTKKL